MPKSKHKRNNTNAQSKKVNRDKNDQHTLKGPLARRAKELREARQAGPMSEILDDLSKIV